MPENYPNNDPLEELFRKMSEEFDIPYNEQDWEKLEARLDRHDQALGRGQWQRWIAAAAIILIALLGYATYSNYMEINRLTALLEESADERVSPERFLELMPESGSAETESGENQNNNASQGARENRSESTDALFAENTSGTPGSDETTDADFLLGKEESESLYRDAVSCTHCTLSEKDVADYLPPTVTSDALTKGDKGAFASNKSAPAGDIPTIAPSVPAVTLGLMLGPDLSTVGSLSGFENPGYKLGMIAEWHISRNLSVSAGLLRSKVQYRAQGTDYQPPEGYWADGVRPDHAFGVCYLLDIPISVKYVMHNFDHSRLYASAGLSSYIMLNEDYRFTYSEAGYGQPERWQADTGTSHWFSTSTFSIGYEQDLNANISLRIEPFVKTPLQDVGWGNVQLYSVGSLFSINYGF